MKSLIFGEQHGFSCQFDEFLFAGGASGVEDFGDVPVVIRAGGDEVAVHRPVVVFAFGKGNQVRCCVQLLHLRRGEWIDE